MVKKRRLSPAPSSAASSPALVAPSDVPSNPASPAPDTLGVPGPSAGSSRLGLSMTPAPQSQAQAQGERGVGAYLAPLSGDGAGENECFLWQDLPMNKNGFRYAFCAPSPNPSPSPRHPFYRLAPPPFPCLPVHLSYTDRSAFLRLSASANAVTTDRGFRSARANVGVRAGSWYYEAIIERSAGAGGAGRGSAGEGGNPHVRVGWGRREAGLDAPVGVDAYSYAIRDVGGEKVHLSRPKPYGATFGTGDVVGCLITLPARPDGEGADTGAHSDDDPAAIRRMRLTLKYKGHDYFEMAEFAAAREMDALVDREGKGVQQALVSPASPPPPAKKTKTKKQPGKQTSAKAAPPRPTIRTPTRLDGSSIRFFLNGVDLGPAYDGLFDFLPLRPPPPPKRGELDARHDDGTLGYYPMVSCFGRGRARVNFGPQWERPPPPAALPHGTRPMSERADEYAREEAARDEADEAAARVRLEKEMQDDAARPVVVPKPKKKKKASTATPTPTPGPGTPGTRDGTPGDMPSEGARKRLPTSEARDERASSVATSARASSVGGDVDMGAVGGDRGEAGVKTERMDEDEGIQW